MQRDPAREAALSVDDLITLLSAVEDKSLPVQIEGCDCSGWAGGIALLPERDYHGVSRSEACVEITRPSL